MEKTVSEPKSDETRKAQWREASKRRYEKKKAEKVQQNPMKVSVDENNSQHDEVSVDTENNEEIPLNSHQNPSSEPQQISSNSQQRFSTSPFVHIDTQSIIAFRETLTKSQQKILDAYMGIGDQKWQQQTLRNDGHGGKPIQYGGYGENPMVERLYQIAEAKEVKSLLGLDKEEKLTKDDVERIIEKTIARTQKESGSDLKTIDYFLKLLEVLRSGTPSPQKSQVEEALSVMILKWLQENANKSTGAENEASLKKEEMRELHDIEMAKLGWDQEKWRQEKANEGKTMEKAEHLIKTVTEGPIGKAIENLGSGAADKIRGGPKVEMVDIQCPNCQHKQRANRDLAQVMCLNCGVLLQKPSEPPQPQPQEPQQPIQEQPSQEKEAPQETPKKYDVKADVLTDF
jgi:ribosomal protein S27E